MLDILKEFDRVCRKNDIKYMVFAGSALGAVRHKGFIPWDDDLDVALLREEYDKLMQLDSNEWDKGYYMQCEYSDHWPIHFSKLRKNNTTCLEKYHPKDKLIHQGIYIDIFPIDNASNIKYMRKLQFFTSKIVIAKSFFKRGYDTDSFFKKIIMGFSAVLPLRPFYSFTTLKKAKNTKYVHSFLGGSVNYNKGIMERKYFTDTVEILFETIVVPISKHYHDMLTQQYGSYMDLPSKEDRKCKVHAILVDTERNYTEYAHYRDNMTFDVLTRSIR